MRPEDKPTAAIIGIGAFVSLMSGLSYLHVTRDERKKRASIKAWERENVACIHGARDRLLALADDPNVTAAEFLAAIKEEQAFLKIIQSQPMY